MNIPDTLYHFHKSLLQRYITKSCNNRYLLISMIYTRKLFNLLKGRIFVLWFFFSSSYVPYIASFSGLSFFDCLRYSLTFTRHKTWFLQFRQQICLTCLREENVLFVGGIMSYLLICVCLRVVVSSTYCVLFWFCLPSSCVLYVSSFSGLSIFECSFGIL